MYYKAGWRRDNIFKITNKFPKYHYNKKDKLLSEKLTLNNFWYILLAVTSASDAEGSEIYTVYILSW